MGTQTIRKNDTKTLLRFLPKGQATSFKEGLRGQERGYFEELTDKLTTIIENAPELYATDGQGDKVKPVLHYFCGSVDIYITEVDKNNGEHFGYTSLGMGYLEGGYINLNYIFSEIPMLNLDYNFTPKTLSEYRKQHEG